MGCPGLDEDFGTVSNPKWPFVVNKDTIPIWASPAMDCEKNEETAGIVEELKSMILHHTLKIMHQSLLLTQQLIHGFVDIEDILLLLVDTAFQDILNWQRM